MLSGTPKPDAVSAVNVELLQKDLINKNIPLFQRYRAMFALRNIGTPAAVDALAAGFSDDSALFKYVSNLVYSHKSANSSKDTRLHSFLASFYLLIQFLPF